MDLRLADMRILADKADVYEEPQPDGTTKRHLVAVGNVVLIRGAERLAGDRVEVDDTGHGFFYNAVGYVEPGVFFEAERVERVDARTYKVEGGRFTACSQPNPRWKFSASRATIEVDDKVIATNTVFRIKGVPAFYLPYLLLPDPRATAARPASCSRTSATRPTAGSRRHGLLLGDGPQRRPDLLRLD